eukprot:560439-Prorocentrum_minimum.AAC.3
MSSANPVERAAQADRCKKTLDSLTRRGTLASTCFAQQARQNRTLKALSRDSRSTCSLPIGCGRNDLEAEFAKLVTAFTGELSVSKEFDAQRVRPKGDQSTERKEYTNGGGTTLLLIELAG